MCFELPFSCFGAVEFPCFGPGRAGSYFRSGWRVLKVGVICDSVLILGALGAMRDASERPLIGEGQAEGADLDISF